MEEILFLKTPKRFDFQRTVMSHGWCELLPLEFDQENWTLDLIVSGEKPLSIRVTEADGGLRISGGEGITESETRIFADIAHIFRFDEDLSEFYSLTKDEKSLAWIAKQNAGRLLRSATVFEDLVKTICTTNCSWGLTKLMVGNLVEKLGASASNGKKAFPTAEAMAKMPVEFYREEIRAGYRSEYFTELAIMVAEGKLNPKAWQACDLPTSELKKEMKRVKGVGNYAAEHLLKLLGRYDGLALDSWIRGQFYKKYNGGNTCEDKQIEAHYDKFGKWRGLAVWCDMTEKWK